MKHLKIGIYELYGLAIIVFALLLRIILASQNWPPTNSDEGTMGLMARHIAYQDAHPIVFYGQNYMGSLEAYLAAILFHLFGPSLFTLRLSVIILIAFFLVSMYLLTSLLYTKKLALVALAFLSLGSSYIFTREIITTGGSAETLLFGSLAFLLATWLSLTHGQYLSPNMQGLRLLAYAGWGLVIGLGLWSDMIVLPIFAMAGLLLLVFCWRELCSLAPICLLGGLLIGALPLIAYNRIAAHYGADSLSILFGLFQGSTTQAPHTLPQILQGISGTVLISIPTATGNPFCPVSELPYIGESSAPSTLCTIIHTGWGVGYLCLLALAFILAIVALWRLRPLVRAHTGSSEEHTTIVLHVARFLLLGGAVLAIVVYAFSSAPMSWPGIHSRYLISLLIVTPAIIAPLWHAASTIESPLSGLMKVKITASGVVLLLLGILLLVGTVNVFSEIPTNNVKSQQQQALINDLLRIGAKHIYTEYWTCDRLAFISNERIICAVLDPDLVGTHNNRYMPYLRIVRADPHAVYVFPIGSPQAATMAHKVQSSGVQYRRYLFDGYIVYQPV